jgi:sugar lactone lactonase YvrE
MRAALGAAAVVLVLLAAPTAANAAAGGLAPRGCLVNEAGDGCAGTGAGSNGRNSAVSPDGRNVYVRAYDTIEIYSRAPNGALTFSGCLSKPMSPYGAMCTASTEFLELQGGIAVSPQGDYVYATTGPGAVLTYTRDPDTGGLTFLGCNNDGTVTGCFAADGTHGANDVTTSPDGHNVYVAAQGDGVQTGGALVVFTRNPNGTLSYNACFKEGSAGGSATCSPVSGLGAANAAVVSPDGTRVYAVGNGGTLIAFSRNLDTGALTFSQCFVQGAGGAGCVGAHGMQAAHGVAVSPDNLNVYVASAFGKAIVRFNNDAGSLNEAGCVAEGGLDGCDSETGLAGMERVVVSHDGHDVYAVGNDIGHGSANEGTLIAFDRADNGHLTKRGCIAVGGVDGCGQADGLRGANGLGISADGNSLHVVTNAAGAGSDRGGVASFVAREVLPACDDKTATVPFGGSATIPLTCTDANSDPVARSIVAQPAHGTLGVIDGTSNTVIFSATAGYSGPDSFTYAGADPDGTGNPATVNLTVAPRVVRCRVPKLRGKTLKRSRKLLKRRHCRLGNVKKPRGVHGKRAIRRLVVKKQSPRAGKLRPRGTRVKVTLGRKKKPGRASAARA